MKFYEVVEFSTTDIDHRVVLEIHDNEDSARKAVDELNIMMNGTDKEYIYIPKAVNIK